MNNLLKDCLELRPQNGNGDGEEKPVASRQLGFIFFFQIHYLNGFWADSERYALSTADGPASVFVKPLLIARLSAGADSITPGADSHNNE